MKKKQQTNVSKKDSKPHSTSTCLRQQSIKKSISENGSTFNILINKIKSPNTAIIANRKTQEEQPRVISHLSSSSGQTRSTTNKLEQHYPHNEHCHDALQGIIQNIQFNGLTPTSQCVMDEQMEAALFSIESGLYGVWRSNKRDERFGSIQDCSRIAPNSKCFCGHTLREHFKDGHVNKIENCTSCKECKRFEFVPTTPEEIGEVWIVRRRDCKYFL